MLLYQHPAPINQTVLSCGINYGGTYHVSNKDKARSGAPAEAPPH